jgi:hypothetical protein
MLMKEERKEIGECGRNRGREKCRKIVFERTK